MKKRKWRWLCDHFGRPQEYHLEEGVIYKLTASLGPRAQLRIHDGFGKPVQSFESTAPFDQMIIHRFTFNKDWHGCLAFAGYGRVDHINLEMVGIDTGSFK